MNLLDLMPLPVDKDGSLDGERKEKIVKKLHDKVQQQIVQQTKQYASYANKGKNKVVSTSGLKTILLNYWQNNNPNF